MTFPIRKPFQITTRFAEKFIFHLFKLTSSKNKLIEEFTHGEETGDGWDNEKLERYISDNNIPCPKCGKSDFTKILNPKYI